MRSPKLLLCIIITFSFILVINQIVYPQIATETIKIGEELKVPLTIPDGKTLNDFKIYYNENYLKAVKINSNPLIFEAKSIIKGTKIQIFESNILINTILVNIESSFKPTDITYDKNSEIKAVEGEDIVIKLSSTTGTYPTSVDIVSNTNSLSINYSNGEIILNDVKENLEFSFYVDKILFQKFNITVFPKINKLELTKDFSLMQKEPKSFSDIISNIETTDSALNKSTIIKERIFITSNNSNVVSIDQTKQLLNPGKTGSATITIKDSKSGNKIDSALIRVNPSPSKIKIVTDSSNFFVKYPNKQLLLKVRIEDDSNELIENIDLRNYVDWTIKSGSNISINETASGAAISAIESKTETATVEACLKNGSKECKEINIYTKDRYNVVAFRPLKIRLDLLDSQTAKDLFGKVAAKNYHIAKIRLFNVLDKNNSDFFGDSILVYSGSLEVKVALEYKKKGEEWALLDETALINEFGKDRESPFSRFTNSVDSNFCKTKSIKNFFMPYRPLSFRMVANTHDRRDEASLRNKILKGLNAVSIGTSFLTSIAVPGAGSDLPLGLDKFQNFLIPGYEKLFPSMREVHRQNIISMVMQPLEEIAFGSDITRVVFFPKKSIKGIVPKTEFKISGISVADACAEVAVIKKPEVLQ